MTMFTALLDRIDPEDPEDRANRLQDTAEKYDLSREAVEILDHATREILLTLQSAKADDIERLKETNPAAVPFLSILSHEFLPEKTAVALSKDPVTLAQLIASMNELLYREGIYEDLEIGTPNVGHLYPDHLKASNDRPE